MSGKLKITGNVLASQKLHAIWENPEEDDDTEKASFAGANESIKPVVTDPTYQLGDVSLKNISKCFIYLFVITLLIKCLYFFI